MNIVQRPNTRPTFQPRIPVPHVEVVSMSALTKSERIQLDNAVSPFGNPERVFQQKVQHLAHMLNCSEEEATAIFLHNL